jgi:hypothetical protein
LLETVGKAMVERACLTKLSTEKGSYKDGSHEGFNILTEKTKRVNELIQSLNGALKKI